MKIISKYKDYYDRALSLGQDNRIPYVRLTEDFPYERVGHLPWTVPEPRYLKKPTLKPGQHPHIKRLQFQFGRIFLCGKTYRYAVIETAPAGFRTTDKVTGKYFDKPEFEYFWSYEKFCKFVESFGLLVKDIYSGRMFGQTPEYAQIEAFLSAQGTTEHESKLVEARVVLVREKSRPYQKGSAYGNEHYYEHNFPLSELQFYKLMDPYQIYQELDMYVCGVLGQQAKEIVQISDKDRINQHGFDKYSFRKPPEEGNKKR
jgi:hypothetical protein